MADIQPTGALPTATEETDAVLRPGTKGNVSVAGLKGVSLEGAQSSDIRERLMQMIAEREGYGKSMQGAMEHMALAASAPGDYTRNYAEHMARNRQREQDLLQMRMGVAQLSSEEARLQREAAEQQRMAQMFGMGPQAQAPAGGGVYPTQGADTMTSTAPSTGGLGLSAPTAQGPGTEGQPAGGLSAVRPQNAYAAPPSQMGTLISSLTPEERMSLYGLGRDAKTRPDMYKELLKRAAPTETERLAASAGLVPGTPEHAAFMRMKIAGSGAYSPNDVRTSVGTQQRTPLESAIGSIAPQARMPAPAAGALTPPASMPAAGAMAPSAVGAQAPGAPGAPAPMSTGFAPGSAEDLKIRQRAAEVEQDITKEAAIESGKKIDVPEQVSLRAKVEAAPDNMLLAKGLINDISANKDLFGKMREPTVWSSITNLLDTGVQVGQFGSVSIPGVKDFVQQLDPQAAKDPKRLDAWSRVLTNMAKIKLNYAKVMLQGQGAVSDNERRLIEQAVGDPSRDSAANMMLKARAVELESMNALEKNKLWNDMKGKMTWAQFTSSPQYMKQQRLQYYRTAKELRIANPTPYPGDE